MTNPEFIARHGDLLIKSVDTLPTGLAKQEDTILAYGEATNHDHRLVQGTVQVYEGKTKANETTASKYFEVKSKNAKLVHQEHKEIEIPKGKYEVLNEREYSPFEEAVKQVRD